MIISADRRAMIITASQKSWPEYAKTFAKCDFFRYIESCLYEVGYLSVFLGECFWPCIAANLSGYALFYPNGVADKVAEIKTGNDFPYNRCFVRPGADVDYNRT